ncbi:MAG: hypothetical protein AAF985_17230 [Bacteroidota bacterium]
MQYKKKIDVNPFNSLGSILTLVFIFVALYFIATSIFKILSWAAPFLLIGALIINHKVVLSYGKWILKLVQDNPAMGIGAILLTIFGFPIISGYLFGKALLYRKVDKMRQEYETRTEGEYIEYEEVDDVELKEPTLKLPQMQKQKRERGNEYEQLFDD